MCNGACGSRTHCCKDMQADGTVPWSGFKVVLHMTRTVWDRGLPGEYLRGAAYDVQDGAHGSLIPCSGDLQADRALVRDGCDVIVYMTHVVRDGGHSKRRLRGSACDAYGGAGEPHP